MDFFLLNKKGLEEMSMLPKNFCNMHIHSMDIAIESIGIAYNTCITTKHSGVCMRYVPTLA